MPHRRLQERHDRWNPEPPEHTQPWGGWTTHEIQTLRLHFARLARYLEDVTDELDRRALMIEAEQKAARDSWGTLIRSLLSNPTLPYFGAPRRAPLGHLAEQGTKGRARDRQVHAHKVIGWSVFCASAAFAVIMVA